MRAQSRDVDVAGSEDPNVRIISGVEDGEQVVADGSFKVHEGDLVADVAATTTTVSMSEAETAK